MKVVHISWATDLVAVAYRVRPAGAAEGGARTHATAVPFYNSQQFNPNKTSQYERLESQWAAFSPTTLIICDSSFVIL